MPIEIKIPQVGESITEVTLASWLKSDGDFVEMDEVLCELESEKATFELNAEAAGILRIKAQEGDAIEIGATVCIIEEGQSQTTVSTEDKSEPVSAAITPKPTGETIEMRVPEVGESITEVTMSAWIKGEGDFVKLDEIIAEIDSDKATFELPAEGSGILHQSCSEGDTLQIGDLICTIALSDAAPAPHTNPEAAPSQAAPSSNQTYASGHASPAAAKILAEKGIDASSVAGSGIDGRITKEDAEKAQKQVVKSQTDAPAKIAQPPAQIGERNETRKKMSSLRKTVARRLVAVKNDTAMLTTFNEVNMAPILELRKKYKEQFKEKHEIGLGFMSFFTKACTRALLEWPSVNGQIDGEEIVHFDYCDISIAVSAPKGLVVPVIRNAEKLSFAGIESEVRRLALKARDGKLSIPEMTGGTFTLTNGGIFGSMMSTPIINSPQSAILGMHNIVERAVVENGEVVVRPMMYLALSYDHRIIDGRESVSFLVRLKELLEDPTRLLLEV